MTLAVSACAVPRTMMPTPAVYAKGVEQAFEVDLPDELKSPDMPVLYATDRMPTGGSGGYNTYGVGRSRSLAMGEATVKAGSNNSWEDLVADAHAESRSRPLRLDVLSVAESVRTPDYPLPYSRVHGQTKTDPEALAKESQAMTAARRLLKERISQAPRKEVLVYIHGVATTFEDSLCATAELWHFMGREFVPIAYSWPAGRGSFLRGYAYDRESSEITLFHFKRFLRWLSSLPEVEGIHLVAHSRGADLTLKTLRELAIESQAKGVSPQKRYKVRNVVLAAPDISGELGLQRAIDGGAVLVPDRWTTYASPRDRAIGVAEFLFSGERMGRFSISDAEESEREEAQKYAGFFEPVTANITYRGRTGGRYGHEFFVADPVVSSDLVLAVRFGREPGPENGRPLTPKGSIFWRIDNDYFEHVPE